MHASNSGKKILMIYATGVLGLIIILNTPISIPCFFLLIIGIPCPACGISRAFIMLIQLDIINAARMNILLLPLLAGGSIYFACAIADVFFRKNAIKKFNSICASKWVITSAISLMLVSWGYNLLRFYQ